jgi:alkanesulfonate monooxygenase SsuD/methylene tetrahydromethanopterin reductase-like flavin-dependent oxidoreductase (luciferase family)
MRLRIFTEPQQGASYGTIRRVAKAAEDLGFDAFFRSDHARSPSRGWTR